MTCATCRFFKREIGKRVLIGDRFESVDHYGDCRRHAPTLINTSKSSPYTHWPEVYAGAFCGDYEAQPAPETKV